MRNLHKLIFLFIFFFSPNVYSDYISDIEIEGMTVESSMLDYMTEKEIKKITKNKENNMSSKISRFQFKKKPNGDPFEVYDIVQIIFEKKKNYKIDGLMSYVTLDATNDNECKNIQNEVTDDILNSFKYTKTTEKFQKRANKMNIKMNEIKLRGGYTFIAREFGKNKCEIIVGILNNKLAKKIPK